MAANRKPLDVDNVLAGMAAALPTHDKDDTNSDISSSYEAIALFAHSCMVAVDFKLLSFSEEQMDEKLNALAPRLTTQWNSKFGSHSFFYSHPQSSLRFVLKVDRLGGKAEIRGLGVDDERIHRLEIVAKDYISSSALPLRITMTSAGEEDRSDLEKKLKELFISESRIKDFIYEFQSTIIQKLIPKLGKEGYEEVETAQDSNSERSNPRANPQRDAGRNPAPDRYPQPARPYPFDDSLAAQPRRPAPDFEPPGFDDEYDLQRIRPPGFGPQRPLGIGHDDLYPQGLGPNDPLRGSFTGGGLPRPGGSGGMHPTFDDPMFGGGGGQSTYDPMAPPGARYDPTMPGDPRGSLGRRPGGRGGGGNFPGFGGFDGDII